MNEPRVEYTSVTADTTSPVRWTWSMLLEWAMVVWLSRAQRSCAPAPGRSGSSRTSRSQAHPWWWPRARHTHGDFP